MQLQQRELAAFRSMLLQDITDTIADNKNGGIREEKFTETALGYLEDASETESPVACREIRENSIGNRIHKINAYAFSEGYETLDLFITIFQGKGEIARLYSEDLKSAVSLSTRFVQHALNDKIINPEETSPVFDFINTLHKIRDDLVRINVFVLSDMLIPLDAPEQTKVGEIIVNYHIRDIEYFHRIHVSGASKESIVINFEELYDHHIPCLQVPNQNLQCKSFLAAVPGYILADIYHNYGSRLLEQNVRTFLQFRGSINKGIRDTILKEPEMFMAYNNGISATAEAITLTDDGKAIVALQDFQIVNGGQTTASIFQTNKKYKSGSIDSIYVQMKISVIDDPNIKAAIVSRISRFANTQNKVSESDLTSNHQFHVQFESFSRNKWVQSPLEKKQTRWFYERARGQYNDEILKLNSASRQKKWIARNPKTKKFSKEDLARFYMSYALQPWNVVRGRQRVFIEFMKIAKDINMNAALFEDIIAMAIIFKTAENLYGSGYAAIGDLRYMVVPYSVAWLRLKTDNRINLERIWIKQQISDSMQTELLKILKSVDTFMRRTAPGGLIGEWAKKQDCWTELAKYKIVDVSFAQEDLLTDFEYERRYMPGETSSGK